MVAADHEKAGGAGVAKVYALDGAARAVDHGDVRNERQCRCRQVREVMRVPVADLARVRRVRQLDPARAAADAWPAQPERASDH